MANVIKSIFGGDTDTTIKLDSDGTQYFLSIKILNSKGEYKSFTSTSFAGLTFESDFNSPFIAGQLQIDNKGNQNLFNSLPDVFDEMPKKVRDEAEKFVKDLKPKKAEFVKRYGKDAKSVMYATAMNMAKKKHGIKDEKKFGSVMR